MLKTGHKNTAARAYTRVFFGLLALLIFAAIFCVRNLFPMFCQCVLADKTELCNGRVGFIAQVLATHACNNLLVRVVNAVSSPLSPALVSGQRGRGTVL